MSDRSDKPPEARALQKSAAPMAVTGPPAAAGAPGRGSAASALTLSLALSAIRRWWKLALPTGLLLTGAAAAAILLTFERRYQADVWIQIFERPPFLVFEREITTNLSQQVVATHLELIRSPMVLFGPDFQRASRMEGLVSEIVSGRLEGWERKEIPGLPKKYQNNPTLIGQWLAEQVAVTPLRRGSELYTISFVSPDPVFAQAAANGFARHYFRLLDDRREAESGEMKNLLAGVLESRRGEVDKEHQELIRQVDQLNGNGALVLGAAGDSNLLPWVGSVRDQLSDAEVELEVRQARVALARDALSAQSETTPEQDPAPRAEPELSVHDLKGLIAATEDRLKATASASIHGDKDPRCEPLRTEIDALEAQLAVALQQARAAADAEQRRRDRERAETELRIAEAEVGLQETIVKLLNERYHKAVEEAKRGNKDRLEIEWAKDAVARKREVIDRLAQRIEVLATEDDAPEKAVLWKWALKPEEPVEATPLKLLALAGAAALVLPFALAVFWESRLRRVHDTERLEAELQLNVLGEIAQLPTRRVRGFAGSNARVQIGIDTFRESFDILGASLSLSDELNGARVIAVTSAVNGEGKTSVATELASSLSRLAHCATLLVDGDTRRPDVHRLFDIPGEPGLARLLSGECSWEEAVFTGWSDELHILPAGRLATNPLQLLGNGTINALLEKALPDYRFIVIDTPPVLATSESLVLAKAADAVLLCVRWEMSRADQVRRARAKLVQAGIRPLGIVISGVPARQYARRYGRYAYSKT